MIRPRHSQLEFVQQTRNYHELAAKVKKYVNEDASHQISRQALYIGVRWLKLGGSHLREARMAKKVGMTRAVYSKSYYAAYNFSKGVRYIANGVVSLKGDDHQAASDLPEDFPDRQVVSRLITELYACRLRADYDNWSDQAASYSMSSIDAVRAAGHVASSSRLYITNKYGRIL
ncbi:hypothetical protein [Xanthomonas campestris]|uniref:hypothetical protein n=1 Tax=Xanthomonas TaxID=338 RepID=UPI001E4C0FED|nr:hypothetical protein [Xanthomonas campestris]MCC5089448.1 hypothetical protein [Xanthomonas campestris]